MRLGGAKGETYWDPATGRAGHEPTSGAVILSRKTAKGRARLGFARTEPGRKR